MEQILGDREAAVAAEDGPPAAPPDAALVKARNGVLDSALFSSWERGCRTVSRRAALLLTVQIVLSFVCATVAGAQTDITAPELIDFSLTPVQIDISGGPATVQAAFQVTDDLAGVASVSVTMTSPGSPLQLLDCSSVTPDSGTILNGNYSCDLEFLPGSQEGTWNVLEV